MTPEKRVQVRRVHEWQIRANERRIEYFMNQVHLRERANEMRREALALLDAEEAEDQ